MPSTVYTTRVPTPLGEVTLMSDGTHLTGLWFAGQKHFAAGLPDDALQQDLPVFEHTAAWLSRYFRGENPGPMPPLAPQGTAFQQRVWHALIGIPSGELRTYSQVAAQLPDKTGKPAIPRAVGSAIARNPISVLIPCHRVVGKGAHLTGYAGGLDRKQWLLKREGVNLDAYIK